jgi:hypothetical protein
MPSAKQNFLDRIIHIYKSLTIETLNDKATTEFEHNNIARLLRNGLAVVGFVALEDFIKSRTGEVLSEIGRSTVPFNSLPEKIRVSTTLESLKSLERLSKFEGSISDRMLLIQNESKKIASTLDTSFELTQYAFGYKSSNISSDDIKDILNAFLVKDVWRKMTDVSRRANIISLPLENSFKNAATRRHTAAHSGNSSIPINDLNQYVKEALAIAISFDCFITRCLSEIKSHNLSYLTNSFVIDEKKINLSKIELDSKKWKYKRENQTRASKANLNFSSLLSQVIATAQANKECLIIYDENHNIIDWYV